MDHVSVSQITMHARCQIQWQRRYLEGEIRPPGIAALVGSGMHKGAEVACRHKAEHGANMPANDVRDVAVAGFDERAGDGVHLGPDEKTIGEQAVVGRGRDRAAAFGHFWGLVVHSEYTPLDEQHIEWRWSMPLPRLGLDLVGVVDLVSDATSVVDWKTGAKRLSQRDADTSLQLAAYSMAAEREFGRSVVAEFEQLLDLKGGTVRHQVSTIRGRADYGRLLARIAAFVKSVRSGVFVPCDPGEWICSRRWCGYADSCDYYVPELEGE
jgi:hypothetical protein